jgi:hypothetical protein
VADTQYEYTEDEWRDAGTHRPLKGVNVNQVFLLHRHWIWANLQRHRFEELLPESKSPDEDPTFMASEWCSAMFLWYSLLWSVIEGFNDRGLELKGRMAEDIDQISDTLRQFRNVVFHVSRKHQHDPRLFGLMQEPGNAARVCRISTGFGRIFIEESNARKAEGEIPDS